MEWIEKAEKVLMSNYAPFPVVFDKGENIYLYDINGEKYLDFTAGIAVNALGYGNKAIQEAITQQINKLTHISNLYYNQPSIEAAELLVQASGLDRVFFCNSGTEANEAAIKLARKYGYTKKNKTCNRIISLIQSFHGRTLGALAATGQTKYQEGFSPLMEGTSYVPINDLQSLKEAVDDTVCAIMLEPIQGEGGIYPLDPHYLKEVRDLCDQRNILLVFDEVQCGIGRTGDMFAFQGYGIQPDILSLAKGLGSGVPVGAVVAKEYVAEVFKPGDHGSTFGANPLVTSVVKTVLSTVGSKEFLDQVKKVSTYLTEQLEMLVNTYDFVRERRGKGLMQGIELSVPAKPYLQKAFEKKLLVIGAGPNVIRFVPPLIVVENQVDEMIDILKGVFEEA
jgi:acetylornithine/N-succinyldiaminopimelate aminotransferase